MKERARKMSYVSKLAEAFPDSLRLEVETAMNLVLERAAIKVCILLNEQLVSSDIVFNVRDAILDLQRDTLKAASGR